MYQALEIAEGLIQLDPVRTYPQRAAALVAKLAKVKAYRLDLEDEDAVASDPPPEGDPAVSLPLRTGRANLGTLHLFTEGDERLAPHELRLARFGARLLCRGMIYARRLATEGRRRSGEDVHEALARAPLTPRERDVVGLLVAGASTREIARRTRLTVATVNTYLKRIFSKLGVHSRVELVARMAGTDAGQPDVQPTWPEIDSADVQPAEPAAPAPSPDDGSTRLTH